jgi:hypothetical protein
VRAGFESYLEGVKLLKSMTTLAEVKVAENAMIAAQKALAAYTDNSHKDITVEGRLRTKLKEAMENYLNVVLALGPKS